jgi:hypothetical protein
MSIKPYIKNKDNEFFIRSSPQTNQKAMLNALGIKHLAAFIAKENLVL